MNTTFDTTKKVSAKECCRLIRDILKPTMALAPKGAICVMFNRTAIERIYSAAKRGAK